MERVVSAPTAALPSLREDLRLFPAAPNRDGSPAWVIQDPARNRFFRIGWLEFELLSRWDAANAAAAAASVAESTPLAATPEDACALAEFLGCNQLLEARTPQDTAYLGRLRKRVARGRWHWLLHHYLFFRIPLVQPARFLARTAPLLGFVFTPAFGIAIAAAGLAGIVLALRQWDAFMHTLAGSLSPEGLFGYLVALAIAKSLHELGHACTATRLGVRVGHMGLALVVLWPMLYTDTGESWKLASRHQRFAIAAAGIATELGVAALATLGWSLSPDGPVREALFFLATTSWVMTLTINASPFMRFDGYFLLADALDIPNLHERSFAMARACLRRSLLGLDARDPEPVTPRMRTFLVGFAFVTWLWRLTVFLAIALAVYHFFFKLLGVVLFAVEIWWFLARPVAGELKVWWSERARIPGRHRAQLGLAALVVCGLVLVPWRTAIRAPAWAHAERQQVLHSPLPGRLTQPAPSGGAVQAGDALFVLEAPEIRNRAAVSRVTAGTLAEQLDRLQAVPEGEEKRAVLERELARELAEIDGDLAELARLEIRAPFAGDLLDVDPELAPGAWVKPAQPLGIVVAPGEWIVEAFVDEAALARARPGDTARFYPRGEEMAPLAGRVESIDHARVHQLPHPMLSAFHGGPVETAAESSRLAPRAALYRAHIRLDAPPAARRVMLGTAVIHAAPSSLGGDAFRRAAGVLVRESGF
jgi:putative peptide zinc metalloprotease protein